MGEEWDDSLQSKEQIEAKLLSKYEATMRRERGKRYMCCEFSTHYAGC